MLPTIAMTDKVRRDHHWWAVHAHTGLQLRDVNQMRFSLTDLEEQSAVCTETI